MVVQSTVDLAIPCTGCILIGARPSWWFSPSENIVSVGPATSAIESYLVKDRLSLTSVTALLAIITTLSLGEQRSLASLVLGDLVLGVCGLLAPMPPWLYSSGRLTLLAIPALAVSSSGLGYVDLNRAH